MCHMMHVPITSGYTVHSDPTGIVHCYLLLCFSLLGNKCEASGQEKKIVQEILPVGPEEEEVRVVTDCFAG